MTTTKWMAELIDSNSLRRRYFKFPVASLLVFALGSNGSAVEIESFVKPYRSIDVAAAEPGILSSCDVKEGDEVAEGQILAKLDHEVQLAMLAMGAKSKDFRGRLKSATAELDLRRRRLAALEELRTRGHAQQEEIDRAQADVAIAEGNLLSAQEDLQMKQLEYERIQAQIEHRTIRAPLNGVVTEVRQQPGEFVSAADPHVLTIVQLDSLLATFSVPSQYVANMQIYQEVRVEFPATRKVGTGQVEFISPVDDAESGTVRIKVRIDNRDGRYRSGQKCVLSFADGNASPGVYRQAWPKSSYLPPPRR